jgi:hypothetical protein
LETCGNLNDTSGDDMSGNLIHMSENLNDRSGYDTCGNLNGTSGNDMSGNLNDMSGYLSESMRNLSGSNVMLADSVVAPESHNSDDIVDTNVPDFMEQISSSILGGLPKGTTNECKADKAESLVNAKIWCAVKYDEQKRHRMDVEKGRK